MMVSRPALATGKGTIRPRSEDAARIPDDEPGGPGARRPGVL